MIRDTVRTPRHVLALTALLAAFALQLASLGLYAVLSAAVVARRGEIGVRSALGARPSQIIALIILQLVAPIGLGLLGGLLLAEVLARPLSDLLFQVSATDPVSLAASAAVLLLAATLAGLVPAIRAVRTPRESSRGVDRLLWPLAPEWGQVKVVASARRPF